MVAFARELKLLHNHFLFSITTNGLLLDKHIDLLVDNDFYVMVSLDGDESNNQYRVSENGQPTYDKLLENLQLVREKYPEFFQRNINFNAVLHNKNSVSQIHRYFKEKFDKFPSIGQLNTSGIKTSRVDDFWTTYLNIEESLMSAENYPVIERDLFVNLPGIQDSGIFLYKYSGCVFAGYRELIAPWNVHSKVPTGTCKPFSKRVFVTVNGKLLACERIGHQFALGTVKEDEIAIDFEAIAAKYNEYFQKMEKLCNVCYERESCKQCVFHLKIDETNPGCNGFMTYEGFARHLSGHISYFENKSYCQ